MIFNKIDAADLPPAVERDVRDTIRRVSLSARTGAGLAELRGALVEAATGIREGRLAESPIDAESVDERLRLDLGGREALSA